MINLLPEKEKRELEMETNWKRIFILLFFVSIFLIVLVVIFAFLKICISSKEESLQNNLLTEEKEFRSSKFQGFKQEIEKTNQDISKIQKFSKEQIFIPQLFEEISPLVPQTIYFTNFSFKKIKKKVKNKTKIFADIYISGIAKRREDLFSFKEKLEKQENFQNVYFSPVSWIAPIDANFSLTFRYIKK